MKTEFYGKDYTVSEQLKKITDKKCRKLKKFFDEDAVAKFTVTLQNGIYKTEIVVNSGTAQYRAETESENPYKNLDVVIPKIEGQVHKKKTIWDRKKKGKINPPKAEGEATVPEEAEPPKPEKE